MKFFIALTLISCAYAGRGFTLPADNDVTGPTPPAATCNDDMCNAKSSGNYKYNYYGDYKKNYFLQCSEGKAYCQACWPSTLVFSERCNQCMYELDDECSTTKEFVASPTRSCPDICPKYGHDYSGNVADHGERRHYAACWKGVTVGCVNCPAGLMFNESWNACLYDGEHYTKPSGSD